MARHGRALAVALVAPLAIAGIYLLYRLLAKRGAIPDSVGAAVSGAGKALGGWKLWAGEIAQVSADPGERRALAALVQTESGGNDVAFVANDGGEPAVGLCQLHPSTAKGVGWPGTDYRDLFDPRTNLALGLNVLRASARVAGVTLGSPDTFLAYAAYNRGPGGYKKGSASNPTPGIGAPGSTSYANALRYKKNFEAIS